MRIKSIYSITLIACLITITFQAMTQDQNTTTGIGQSLAEESRAEDVKLNETYNKILSEFNLWIKDGTVDNAKEWKENFIAAQRKWIEFKEADCMKLVPEENKGGSIAPTAVTACILEKTKSRTKELTSRYLNR